jgi:uracil-DNA glycosylase family 4
MGTLFDETTNLQGFPTGESLEEVQRAATEHECSNCRDKSRSIFGEGKPNAKVMFIGESPSPEDAVVGRPFLGQTGDVLNKIIAAMGLKREECYLCNVLKCPMPAGRTADRADIEKCRPLLMRQIAAVRPRVIIAMGTVASQTILNTGTPISKLRGSFVSWNGMNVMPTFNPAYLLRVPEKKREAWEDFKQVREYLKTV